MYLSNNSVEGFYLFTYLKPGADLFWPVSIKKKNIFFGVLNEFIEGNDMVTF